MERLFKNWRTTTGAVAIIICLTLLLYFEKIDYTELTGIIALVLGGGGAVALAASKDKKE